MLKNKKILIGVGSSIVLIKGHRWSHNKQYTSKNIKFKVSNFRWFLSVKYMKKETKKPLFFFFWKKS